MDASHAYASDIAFTPSIKQVQTRKGSREAYRRMEERGSWETRITPDLAAFIAAQTSVFLATVNAEGQPYIQHRGGPPGFLKVVDAKTIGFVDRSEEHTSELQSLRHLVCRLLLEKKNKHT